LDERFRVLKQRYDTEVLNGRVKDDDRFVVELAFRWHCENEHNPPLRAPSGMTVCNWMSTSFGTGSELGHTVIHPHKTDECDTCGRLKGDIDSVSMTIRRHKQQHDVSLARVQAVQSATAITEELEKAMAEHLEEAQESKLAYKELYAAASHKNYCSLTEAFNALPRSAFTACGLLNSVSPEAQEVNSFLDRAASFKGAIDSDYQQDKAAPHWGRSPQPGPTQVSFPRGGRSLFILPH
jgi:hypothetical protein